MVSKKLGLFLSSIVALLLLVSLLRVVLPFEGSLFKLEIFGFFVLSIMILIGLASIVDLSGKRWLYFTALFSLINSLLLGNHLGNMNWTVVFYSILLLVLNLPNKKDDIINSEIQTELNPSDQNTSVVFDSGDHKAVLSTVESDGKNNSNPVKKVKKGSTNNYVGSKRGKFYHEVGSEWGKRIKKANAVFFLTREEAWSKGYKPHADVQ